MALQTGWRFCHKCQGLFFSGNPSHGVCPADHQAHDSSESGKYALNFGESAPGVDAGPNQLAFNAQQGEWRWCHKCQGMFFAGNASKGKCPADNQPHDPSQSGHYAMVFDDGLGTIGQQNWRWCHKCQGLFFAGNLSKGQCPADAIPLIAQDVGGPHHRPHDPSQSGKYQLQFEPPPIK